MLGHRPNTSIPMTAPPPSIAAWFDSRAELRAGFLRRHGWARRAAAAGR